MDDGESGIAIARDDTTPLVDDDKPPAPPKASIPSKPRLAALPARKALTKSAKSRQIRGCVATRFGEARAKVLERYTKRSYRVKINPVAKAMMYTSNVRYGAAANDHPSMEAAIEAHYPDRARDGK